jgi:hypothetical protein
MEKIKIYISGKISGLQEAEYKENFARAEELLQAKGYQVTNPLKNGVSSGEHWRTHMKQDINLLLDCDVIYMLENWEKSEGAALERHIASALGITVLYEREPKYRDVKKAIEDSMGVNFKTIAEDSRNRWHVYARMIYAHSVKKRGETSQRIASETNHDECTIAYYLRKYDSEYKFNREFRAAAEKVATLLSKKLKQEDM